MIDKAPHVKHRWVFFDSSLMLANENDTAHVRNIMSIREYQKYAMRNCVACGLQLPTKRNTVLLRFLTNGKKCFFTLSFERVACKCKINCWNMKAISGVKLHCLQF